MADTVDAATRSRMMSGIRGTNTRPEIMVRQLLHAEGFRFRLHARNLPGRPDIVLRKHRAVVLVHGCFWHGHDCHFYRLPGTRTEFWRSKVDCNRRNDARTLVALREAGWRTAVVWECALKGRQKLDPEVVSARLARWIRSASPSLIVCGTKVREK